MNAAIFEANSDDTTKRVHEARRKALATLNASPCYNLIGINAYATDVKSTHQKAGRFDLFSGMGHGGDDCFEGQSGYTIFDTSTFNSTNESLKGAIVHLYSCNCAKKLGPFLISRGAKAFIGYNNPVIVPLSQAIVDEFVKVAAVIDASILNGDSSARTKAKAEQEFKTVEAHLLSTASNATPRDVATFRMNQNSLIGPWSSYNNGFGSY